MLSVLGPCSSLTRVCARGRTQCIERAHSDSARLEDVLDKELQRDDIEDSAPSGSCLVCCEELAQPTLFDCGHPVCFTCTTNMLVAKPKDAVYALPCPWSCRARGQISFLSCASARDGFACAAGSPEAVSECEPEAVSEWRTVENAMLRATGMYPCPSPACTKDDILLFIPPGKMQAAEDTECESCGLHICTTCTRTAGKVVAFHEPFPCAQRVAFEGQLSAIQAGMHRANEIERAAAVQREREREREEIEREEIERDAAVLAGRHIPRRRIPRQHEEMMWEREGVRGMATLWDGRWEETRRGWIGRHCPKIDEHIFELLGKGEWTVSYAEIFDAAATATKAAVEREKKRREHSPTTKRALANYETFHGLPSGTASVDQVSGLGLRV